MTNEQLELIICIKIISELQTEKDTVL